jgi:hypothetical protein
MAKDHWDAILASSPLNATAGRVLSKGVAFEPEVQPSEHSWEAPPALVRIGLTHRANASFVDLTGFRVGRLTVLGMVDGMRKEARGALWACRCACGRYVGRRAKSLKTMTVEEAMCNACNYTAKLRAAVEGNGARQRAESEKARKW